MTAPSPAPGPARAALCAGLAGLAGLAALTGSACSPRAGEPAPSSRAAPRPEIQPRPSRPGETPPTIRLPATAVPLRQSVDLTIIPDQDHYTGAVAIQLDLRERTSVLWLNAKQIDVQAASIEPSGRAAGGAAGARVAASRIAESSGELLGLRLASPVGPGPALLRIDYRGTLVDDDYIGLFRERAGGEAYVFSQFEIGDARRAFPCFDEPAYKIPWDVTLHVRAGHVALASSPVARETPGPGPDMKTVEFRPTQPLPSYLVAFAVGPFDLIDAGKGGERRVPLGIAVPRGRAGEARAARRTIPAVLAQLEGYFAMPYPYEKLDSVAVPQFFGAMENAAHITYGADILLAPPAVERTPDFQRRHRSTITHEIAHQWFGDLVTPAWWDDMWLNESFATWLEAKLTRPTRNDAASSDDVGDREGAMQTDALPGTRAIHQPVEHRDDFLFLFDPINYGKGAAVIAMFERWVGADRFRAGVRAYLRQHAGGTATTADFLAALDAAAPGRDVAAAFRTFLDQPGVPLVSMELRCAPGRRPTLALRQEPFGGGPRASARRWRIPICVGYGGARARHQCTLLDQAGAELELGGASCPTWVSGNAGVTGYYRVAYGGDLLARILSGRAPATSEERSSALDDAVAQADAGRLPYGVLIAALPALARSRDFSILRRVVDLVGDMEDLVPADRRDAYAALVRSLFGARARAMSWRPRAGEPVGARLLRPDLLELVTVQGRDPALIAGAERLARAYLRDPSTLPPDLAAPVLAATAATRGSAELHGAYVASLRREQLAERRAPLITGLAHFRDPALVARTVELAASPEIRFAEVDDLLAGGRADPSLAGAVHAETVKRIAALARKLGPDRRIFLLRTGASLCSDAERDRADRFFAEHLGRAPGIEVARSNMREQIDRCTARRAAQSSAVRDALGSH